MDDRTFQAELLETQVFFWPPDLLRCLAWVVGHVNEGSYQVELRKTTRTRRRPSAQPEAHGRGCQAFTTISEKAYDFLSPVYPSLL